MRVRIEEAFFAQASRTPERWALADPGGRLRYRELAYQVKRRAEALRRLGAKAGQVFGLLGENGIGWLREALAVLACGGILMPLHPDLTDGERQRLFAQVLPDWLLTVEGKDGEGAHLRRLDGSASRAGWPGLPEREAEELFFLGFTSGSTGMPKGLLKTHRSWTASFAGWTESFGLKASDRVLLPLHLSYSAQLYSAFHALSMGAEVFLLPRFSPAGFFQAQATCAVITPALIQPLVRHAERRRSEMKRDAHQNAVFISEEGTGRMATGLSDVVPAAAEREGTDFHGIAVSENGGTQACRMPQLVISVGTKLTVAQRARFERHFPGCALFEYYGSSEMGYVSLVRPEDARVAPETVGRPFPGVEVAVLDEAGRPLPAGQAGKLYVRTPQAFVGYVGRPEETAASFRNGWVTSHDLALIREDGRILLLGRQREVIKAGGSMVYVREVEETLMSCPGVEDAAVVAGQEEERGEVVWAAVVLQEGVELSSVRAWCRSRLAGFKQPRRWRVFAELPRNRHGKVDKLQIREQMAEEDLPG